MKRNGPCPCGSGRRYKACCGTAAAGAAPAPSPPVVDALMRRALALQQTGRLVDAAALYREALHLAPELPDAVHMLGAAHLQAGEYAAALHHLRRAGELLAWRLPSVRHNLGLAIAAALAHRDRPDTERLWEAYDRWRDGLRHRIDRGPVSVSVVIPGVGYAPHAEEALESVFAQTHRDIEVVVVADPSSDASATRIRPALRRSPFPTKLLSRTRPDSAERLNEAVALSSGRFVNVLDPKDRFPPSRIATMVDAIPGRGQPWGFSRVALIDEQGAALADDSSPLASELCYRADSVTARDTAGTAFLSCNAAVTAGALFERVGGFDEAFRHDLFDDFEFRLRLSATGARTHFLPKALAWHDHPVTLAERARTMRRCGVAARHCETRHAGIRPWADAVARPVTDYVAALRRAEEAERRESTTATRGERYLALMDLAFAQGYRGAADTSEEVWGAT